MNSFWALLVQSSTAHQSYPSLYPSLFRICLLIYNTEMRPEEWFNNKRCPLWEGEQISVLGLRERHRHSSGKGVAKSVPLKPRCGETARESSRQEMCDVQEGGQKPQLIWWLAKSRNNLKMIKQEYLGGGGVGRLSAVVSVYPHRDEYHTSWKRILICK